MTWEQVVALIIAEGLPVAAAIYQKWGTGKPPTLADFDELRRVAKQTAEDRAKAKLAQMGIGLDSEKAKQILALVSAA